MSRGKALIIEDEPMVQILLEDICATFDVDVTASVDNVADALAEVAKNDFNVAILDVNLIDGTSEAVARALKATGKPVIVSTGSHIGELPDDYEGFCVIHKPFNVKEISLILCQTAFSN